MAQPIFDLFDVVTTTQGGEVVPVHATYQLQEAVRLHLLGLPTLGQRVDSDQPETWPWPEDQKPTTRATLTVSADEYVGSSDSGGATPEEIEHRRCLCVVRIQSRQNTGAAVGYSLRLALAEVVAAVKTSNGLGLGAFLLRNGKSETQIAQTADALAIGSTACEFEIHYQVAASDPSQIVS